MAERWANISKSFMGNYLEAEFSKTSSGICRKTGLDGVDRFSWIHDLGGIMEWGSVS